ncbi:Shr3 amino acid permease chaperone [Mycotypha africana]|uniref:Shr3 amino acid permease chaperone n=1 Tax=Mycotypha africana TaxID=64632 RepID=UPI0023004776|nr:Shr3 amino acid permease chaperone [Mycotypha africana]KAI8991003.1 Shr3 amino acid permease chaperone [Mycotypha africana]
MAKEHMQSAKVVLILCSCFFAYGTVWSDWAFDYYFLWAKTGGPDAVARAAQYYINQLNAPDIIKYIPFVNLMIAAVGFAAGIANMTDGNILFDGASLVLMLFALSTYATTVKPAMQHISETEKVAEISKHLKNIAAAHFIITLAITGIVGLQITHYILNKRADHAERAEMEASSSSRNNVESKKSK